MTSPTGSTGAQTLFLTGSVGVGKTTTAYAAGELLVERGVPHAVIDLDALRRGWPAPEADPFNSALELANLRAYAANARAAGALVLILAGVAEDVRAVGRYSEATGAPLTLVRLTTRAAEADRRLRCRHAEDPAGLAWHLHRFPELEAALDAADLPGPVIDTTGRTPREVAGSALDALRLPAPPDQLQR